MSDKNKIQIPLGIPRWLLFWELFNNSKQLGMGALQKAGRGPMTMGEAYLEYGVMSNRGQREIYLDYYKGRMIKSLIPPLEDDDTPVSFNTWGYDRDFGEGACARVIKGITDKLGGKYKNGMYEPYSCSWFGIEKLEPYYFELEGFLDDLVSSHIGDKNEGRINVDVVSLHVNKLLADTTCQLYLCFSLDSLVVDLDGISSGRLTPDLPLEGDTYAEHTWPARPELSDEEMKKIIADNPLTIRKLEL